MTKTQRLVVFLFSLAALIGSALWLMYEPGFEPAILLLAGIAGIASTCWPKRKASYQSKRQRGRVTFDYSNNNGRHIIGEDDLQFETAWSKASDTSIHIYNDPPSIEGVALVNGIYRISDITDASFYDMSSRARTPQEGDVVVLRNKYENYAALKIIDIKDQTRSDDRDELTFEYVINPDRGVDFS